MSDNYMYLPDLDKPLIVTMISRRIKRNQNFIAAITGGTGSGKSYSAIRLAEVLSKELKVSFGEENICFSVYEMMKLINSGSLKSGSVIILDEAGVSVNNRKWNSKSNINASFLTQTFRHRNFILLLCVPDLSFVDVAQRKLIHAHFETFGIDYKNKIATLKPKTLDINQSTGKIFYKYPLFTLKGSEDYKITKLDLNLASKELLKIYEDKKESFTDELNKRIEEQTKEDGFELKELTKRQKEVFDLRNTGLTISEISSKLNIFDSAVYNHLKAAKKKGYVLD